MGGMLSLAAPFSMMLADMDGWGNLIYLAFFILAGLASALAKLKKTRPGQEGRGHRRF